jgi:hypothetical protein
MALMLWRRDQRGFALVAVLAILVALTVLGGLLLHLVMKETRLGALRRLGAQSLYLAEAGGYAARAGLMALVNEDPLGVVSLDAALSGTQMSTWYAGGNVLAQNPLALFDYLVLDGQRYNFGPTSETPSLAFEVAWDRPDAHRKLRAATGTPPANALGRGRYRASLVVSKRLAPHPAIPGEPQRYIQHLGPDFYEFFYSYRITSDGEAGLATQGRRRVILSGDFSLRVRRQSFARYLLFTHVHTTPSGGDIWFTNRTSFDGPVHTNGEFRFAFFPKFSDRVTSAGCTNPSCTNTPRDYAWFINNGDELRRQANENVVGGIRRDAPVRFDATPENIADDDDNAAANFTRGVAPVTVPPNSYNQRAITIGHDPGDTTPNQWSSSQWKLAIRRVIPELADTTSTVPNGIYVPVTDRNGNGVSDAGEPLAGGIYVEGNLTSLTLGTAGGGNVATYTFVQGSQTVTVTVDRGQQTTTVTNTAWPAPQTRTFAGVPKGWQSVPGSENATMIYIQGDVGVASGTTGLSGTLEEKEQTTIVASGRIDITGHLRYEDPPEVTDPFDSPFNVLGLYSAGGDIRITAAAPDDLVLHAVLMAGQPGVSDGHNSAVFVQNHNSGSPRGFVHMIGGIIEEHYGAFGTFSPSTGAPQTGYGRDFNFDRRLTRGIEPPYFPTSTLFEVVNGSERIAGVRPIWREAAP